MVAQGFCARIVTQNPFGVQNPDSAKALQLSDDSRIVLTRLVQIIADQIFLHSNTPILFLPRSAVMRTHLAGSRPRLSFSLTGKPERARVVVSRHYFYRPLSKFRLFR